MSCPARCKGIRRAAVHGLFALWLAPLPALAGSQSSNSPVCTAESCVQAGTLAEEEFEPGLGVVPDAAGGEPPLGYALRHGHGHG